MEIEIFSKVFTEAELISLMLECGVAAVLTYVAFWFVFFGYQFIKYIIRIL